MRGLEQLEQTLRRIDGAGYGAYKRIAGEWGEPRCTIVLDRVQGDPFAAPSCARVEIPHEVHGLPPALWSTRPRRVACCDYLIRRFARALAAVRDTGGSGASGRLSVDAGDAEMLARSACDLGTASLSLRFRVGLPARGRRVMGRAAATLLTSDIPRAAASVRLDAREREELCAWVRLAEDHDHLQRQLSRPDSKWIAFIRDGSVLARASGVSSRPLADAVPTRAPASLRVTLDTLHHGPVTGLGIPRGVTLITGGGFHGKTTMLEAIQAGIYPHIPGDGREWVVSDPALVKVRSEDGRSVVGVDLGAFIHELPAAGGAPRDTRSFHSADASGSTSLAAAIVEAHELGASGLLIDEDTSATNLLIRDARMQALVERETITPLIDHVRGLSRDCGLSTILVVGGCGDYLDVADVVILMQDYRVLEVTERAQAIAHAHPTGRAPAVTATLQAPRPRVPAAGCLNTQGGRGGRPAKIRAHGLREIRFGDTTLELGALEQLVDESQARTIGSLLRRVARRVDGVTPLRELVTDALEEVERQGLYALDTCPELAGVRPLELGAAVNRLRLLELTRGRES